MFRMRWIVAGVVGSIIALALFPVLTMWLWNWLIPPLFHGPTVTWSQALGLLVLSHILFRGGRSWVGGGRWRHERWRRRFAERLESLSPEDRERFRAMWARRWACGPDAPAGPETKDQPTS